MNLTRSLKLIIFVFVYFPSPAFSTPSMNMCTFGDVRLDTSLDTSSYLQVCVMDEANKLKWAFVCGNTIEDPWTPDSAYVWCRTRGVKLASETSRGSLTDPIQTRDLKIKDVSCNRTQDATITDCDFTTTTDPCGYIHGVECQFCVNANGCNAAGVCNVESGMCHCHETCMNGGFCDFGKCQCLLPFYGPSCQNKYCTYQCLNGGECSLNGTCQCPEGYYGDTCELKHCIPECGNNGTCLESGECECHAPFYGDVCEKIECTYPCINGGQCLSNGTCQCQPSFYGSICEFKMCANPCNNGGECLGNGTCQCKPSFYGETCEFNLCVNPCKNDGICLSNGTCQCQSSSYGNVCEFNLCTNPCKNDGLCLGNGTCQCKTSFYGSICEFKSCTSLCLNGGECNSSTGVCDCISPYTGPICAATTPCVSNCGLVLSPVNLLIVIIIGSSVGIAVLLILIFIASLCLIKIVRRNKEEPRSNDLNLRELPRQTEEPLYEYLDGECCTMDDDCTARVNQFGEPYSSNVYEYIKFPLVFPGANRTEMRDSMELTYDSADPNGYEIPLPASQINNAHLWRLGRSKEQMSESYVKMYPTSSCPSLL